MDFSTFNAYAIAMAPWCSMRCFGLYGLANNTIGVVGEILLLLVLETHGASEYFVDYLGIRSVYISAF